MAMRWCVDLSAYVQLAYPSSHTPETDWSVSRQPQENKTFTQCRLNVGAQSAVSVQFFFIYHMVFICLPHRLAFKLYNILKGNCLGSPSPHH